MPQSLACLLVHIVFSTKNRDPVLDANVRPALHAYLSAIARNVGCEGLRVGGVEDHVHLAVRVSRTITMAQLVEELKTSSTKWLKKRSPQFVDFAWQRGYGAFSVSRSELDRLLHYIDNQVKHHQPRSFRDEYLDLLVQNGVEYDERFLWD
jgi:putative transposase